MAFFEPEAGFLAGAALPRDAAERVGAALSLLELELCEFERAFSPSAEASDRLERSVRFSAGIVSEAIGQLPTARASSGGRAFKDSRAGRRSDQGVLRRGRRRFRRQARAKREQNRHGEAPRTAGKDGETRLRAFATEDADGDVFGCFS